MIFDEQRLADEISAEVARRRSPDTPDAASAPASLSQMMRAFGVVIKHLKMTTETGARRQISTDELLCDIDKRLAAIEERLR